MQILTCQREMRSAFLGGFAGQMVAGLIWLLAALVSSLTTTTYSMLTLFFGSMLIFPLTQLLLRLIGRPARVSPENRLWALGSQVAFIVPIGFLLVGAAALYQETWFFPAAMILVGAHYLPFITLYGMRMFGILVAALVILGTGLALYGPPIFGLGGWIGGALMVLFAFVGRHLVLREEATASAP